MNETKAIVISIQGVGTNVKWSEKLGKILETQNMIHKTFKFDYRDIFNFPHSIDIIIEKFCSFYCEIQNNTHLKPSIIADYFSTYILVQCLLNKEIIKFNKIILSRSFLTLNFNWNTLLARNQVNQVLIEFVKRDFRIDFVKRVLYRTQRTFKYESNVIYPTFFEKRVICDSSNYFDENHINEHWISFLNECSPIFQIKHGKEFFTEEYCQKLAECREIDIERFEKFENFKDAVLPEGLSGKWITVNNDIHTFVIDEDSKKVMGYINAMPLKDSIFEKIKTGCLTDSEIQNEDILPYTKNANLKVYIMCIATKEEVRQFRGEINNTVADRLFAGLFKKWIDYWMKDGVIIDELAGIAWTPQGEKICELLGMKQISQDRFKHPVFWMNALEYKRLKKIQIEGINSLVSAYKKSNGCTKLVKRMFI